MVLLQKRPSSRDLPALTSQAARCNNRLTNRSMLLAPTVVTAQEGLKARGAKQLELTSSPEGNVVEKVNVPALKLRWGGLGVVRGVCVRGGCMCVRWGWGWRGCQDGGLRRSRGPTTAQVGCVLPVWVGGGVVVVEKAVEVEAFVVVEERVLWWRRRLGWRGRMSPLPSGGRLGLMLATLVVVWGCAAAPAARSAAASPAPAVGAEPGSDASAALTRAATARLLCSAPAAALRRLLWRLLRPCLLLRLPHPVSSHLAGTASCGLLGHGWRRGARRDPALLPRPAGSSTQRASAATHLAAADAPLLLPPTLSRSTAAAATVAPPKAFNPADVPKAAPVAEPEEVVVKAAPAPAAPAPTAPTVGAGSAAPTQFGTASSASTGGVFELLKRRDFGAGCSSAALLVACCFALQGLGVVLSPLFALLRPATHSPPNPIHVFQATTRPCSSAVVWLLWPLPLWLPLAQRATRARLPPTRRLLLPRRPRVCGWARASVERVPGDVGASRAMGAVHAAAATASTLTQTHIPPPPPPLLTSTKQRRQAATCLPTWPRPAPGSPPGAPAPRSEGPADALSG